MSPIDLNLPRFEWRTEDGITAVREGFVVAFFIPHGKHHHASAVAEAATRYLSLPDIPGSLAVVDDNDQPIARAGAEVVALIQDAAKSGDQMANVVVRDTRNADRGFSLTYFHVGRRRAMADNWPNAGAGLRFCFPYEFQGDHVLLGLRDFADGLTTCLPFSSGYVAPAFLYDDGICKSPAFDVIKGLSRRYLCLDIPDLVVDCFEAASGVKGAYWGNYLSETILAELGGVDRIVSPLSPFDTRSRVLASGALALYLHPFPIAGDVNRRENVGVYGAAAGLLAPCMRKREVPYSGFSEEDMAAWLHRFGHFALEGEDRGM